MIDLHNRNIYNIYIYILIYIRVYIAINESITLGYMKSHNMTADEDKSTIISESNLVRANQIKMCSPIQVPLNTLYGTSLIDSDAFMSLIVNYNRL